MNKGEKTDDDLTSYGYNYYDMDPDDHWNVDSDHDREHQDSRPNCANNTLPTRIDNLKDSYQSHLNRTSQRYEVPTAGNCSCTTSSTFENESHCDFVPQLQYGRLQNRDGQDAYTNGYSYYFAPGQGHSDVSIRQSTPSEHKEAAVNVPFDGFEGSHRLSLQPSQSVYNEGAYHTGINKYNIQTAVNSGNASTPGSPDLLHAKAQQNGEENIIVSYGSGTVNSFEDLRSMDYLENNQDGQRQHQHVEGAAVVTANSTLSERGRRFSDPKDPHAFSRVSGYLGIKNAQGLYDCFPDCSNRRYADRGNKRRANLLQHLRSYHGQHIPYQGSVNQYSLGYSTQE